MKKYSYEGKIESEVLSKALLELNKEETDLFIKKHEEETGLFKTKKIKLEVLVKEEVLSYLKEILIDIISKMGIEVKIEGKIREKYLKLTLFSNNNSILIGSGGRTIDSFQTILKNILYNKYNFNVNIIVDVEDYKEKRDKRLEMLGRNTARDVLRTGIEVKLDSMNSYERRIVHEAASKINGICTESIGEEPNRYIVIKPNK